MPGMTLTTTRSSARVPGWISARVSLMMTFSRGAEVKPSPRISSKVPMLPLVGAISETEKATKELMKVPLLLS
ncbi:hypothetical protein D3C72_1760570 [compost metagenome]